MAALVMVAECGSFWAAAERLGITASAVSKVVSRVEKRLRIRLLDRTTRRVQLTDIGNAYCIQARRILDDLEGVERDVRSRDPQPSGSLRVTAPVLLGNERVLPIALAFAGEYPDVRFHLDLSDRVVDVMDERIDVSIRLTATPPEYLIAKKLDADRRVLCASPSYLAGRGTPKTPADLAHHDCVVFVSGRRPPATWSLLGGPGGNPRPVPINGRIHINSTPAMRELALAGFGIADLPYHLVHGDLRQNLLVSVLAEFVPVERFVFAVYVPSRFVPPKIRYFVKALEQGFRQQDEGTVAGDRTAAGTAP